MNSLKSASPHEKTSSWSKTRRDLATPQGASLISALIMCAIISLALEMIGVRYLKLPRSIVYTVIVLVDILIIVISMIRIKSMNKYEEEKRREIFYQKFGADMDAIKKYDELKKSGAIGQKKPSESEKNLTYEDAGVSIDTKAEALENIKEIVRSTYRPEVLSDMGNFGGLFALDKTKYQEPVLVSSNDSVGTKLKVAFMTGKHNTVGYDIVAHCANDILVQGAESLFFLDYIGTSKVDPKVMNQIMEGLAAGCRDVGCTLIGGETAELPSFYQIGEYDLVGTIVGVVERKKILTGETIKPGDDIIGMASSGLHTNGYSLARKILFDVCGYKTDDFIKELGTTVGDELLKVHKSYAKPVLELLRKYNNWDFVVKGLAHITGGGMLDNIPRILPKNCNAVIEKGKWEILPVFSLLQEKGKVEENEMYRVFNMGIGMVAVVSPQYTDSIIADLNTSGEKAYLIGKITEGERFVIIK